TPPRRQFRRPSGRLVLGLAAAALLASLVAAGVTRTGGTRQLEATRPPVSHGTSSAGAQRVPDARRALEKSPAPVFGAAIVPADSPARLQRYQATLRLRVENVDSLSTATKRAQRVARSLGGYVGQVQYSTH